MARCYLDNSRRFNSLLAVTLLRLNAEPGNLRAKQPIEPRSLNSAANLGGDIMSVDLTGGHPDMDYDEHRRTYKGFLVGAQVLIAIVAVILVGMLVFLV